MTRMTRMTRILGISAAAAVAVLGWRVSFAQSQSSAKAAFMTQHDAIAQQAAQTPPPATLPMPANPNVTPAPARIVWENGPAPVPAGAEQLGMIFGAPGEYDVANYLITPYGPVIFAGAMGSGPGQAFLGIQTANGIKVVTLPPGSGWAALTTFSSAGTDGTPNQVSFATENGLTGTITVSDFQVQLGAAAQPPAAQTKSGTR
jgi:type II secretory pathway pseudopilin PulG